MQIKLPNHRQALKAKIIELNLIPYHCNQCKNTGLWESQRLVLQLDHINGNKSDHRIENLRAATHSTNNFNKVVQSNNKLGMKNISWHHQNNKWWVQLVQNKKKVFSFFTEDLELAELVAIEARNKYHGEFANHGARL